jgi:hypothetical protein
VAQRIALVAVPQVGVGVDLDHAEVAHARVEIPANDAPGDGVLAAEHDG